MITAITILTLFILAKQYIEIRKKKKLIENQEKELDVVHKFMNNGSNILCYNEQELCYLFGFQIDKNNNVTYDASKMYFVQRLPRALIMKLSDYMKHNKMLDDIVK